MYLIITFSLSYLLSDHHTLIFMRNFMLCFQCKMIDVVVDVGDGATHIVPATDGYVVIGSSIRSILITGKKHGHQGHRGMEGATHYSFNSLSFVF